MLTGGLIDHGVSDIRPNVTHDALRAAESLDDSANVAGIVTLDIEQAELFVLAVLHGQGKLPIDGLQGDPRLADLDESLLFDHLALGVGKGAGNTHVTDGHGFLFLSGTRSSGLTPGCPSLRAIL